MISDRESTAARPPAVVVGACAHGLSVVRALSGHGVDIFVVDSAPGLPGAHTCLARFVPVAEDINTPGLVDALLRLRQQLWSGQQPVLFLTNDNMVLNLAGDWPRLQGKFLMSWSGAREDVSRLLLKSALDDHCRMVGMNYPRSLIIDSSDDLAATLDSIEFPAIVKPDRPLSGFKAEIVRSTGALSDLLARFPSSYPLVIQNWIPGKDDHLHFCNLYLIGGKPCGRFEGRKLRSFPPARGQGTVVESSESTEVFDLAMRFFKPLNLSGPAALELKQDGSGKWWVIEPTLGRTEFLVGCCVANGVNLPLIEYLHQTGGAIAHSSQRDDYLWFNSERDPGGLFAYVFGRIPNARRGRRWHLLYFSARDLRPFLAAVWRDLRSLFRRALAKSGRLLKRLKKPDPR